MSGGTEQQIEARLRAGLAERAGHALDGSQVRTALAAAPPPQRRFGRWIAAAAAVVVVSVGVPVGVSALAGHQVAPKPQVDEPTDLVPAPAPSPARARPDYRPGWLPPDMVEQYREIVENGTAQLRDWVTPTHGDQLRGQVTLMQYDANNPAAPPLLAAITAATDTITVNGHRASVSVPQDDPAALDVTWAPAPGIVLRLSVSAPDNTTSTAAQIADSVRSVAGSTELFPLSFGLVPTGFQPGPAVVQVGQGTGPSWAISAAPGQQPGSLALTPQVQAQLSTSGSMPKPAPGGPKAVTVRGEPGSYELTGNGASVTARTSDGRWLTVVATPTLSADQLVAIADGLRIGAADDPSWSNR